MAHDPNAPANGTAPRADTPAAPAHDQRKDQPLKQIGDTSNEAREEAEREIEDDAKHP